jgi:hypothetical protein
MRRRSEGGVGLECQEHIGFHLRSSQMPVFPRLAIKAQGLSEDVYQACIDQKSQIVHRYSYINKEISSCVVMLFFIL